MTDRQIGMAMLGLVGIAAFILWMHDKVPPLATAALPGLSVGSPAAPVSGIAPQDYPVQSFPGFNGFIPSVIPLVALGSQPAGSEAAGCGCMSWCGTVS